MNTNTMREALKVLEHVNDCLLRDCPDEIEAGDVDRSIGKLRAALAQPEQAGDVTEDMRRAGAIALVDFSHCENHALAAHVFAAMLAARPAQAEAQSGEQSSACKCPDWCRERCTCAMETIVPGMPQPTTAPVAEQAKGGEDLEAPLRAVFKEVGFRQDGDLRTLVLRACHRIKEDFDLIDGLRILNDKYKAKLEAKSTPAPSGDGENTLWRVRYYGSPDLNGYNIYAFKNSVATHGDFIANIGENGAAAEAICAAHNKLAAAFIEEQETSRQLNRALRDATEGPTFMGEPVLPHAAHSGDGERAALLSDLRGIAAVIRKGEPEWLKVNDYKPILKAVDLLASDAQAGGELVGEMVEDDWRGGTRVVWLVDEVPAGTKLYTKPQEQAGGEAVKFLANGTRYKVSMLHGGDGSIMGLPAELCGRWVALVAADDDCHLQLTKPQAAVALTEDEVWQTYMSTPVDIDCHVYDLHKFARAVIAKFCEVNGITAPEGQA